MNKRNLVTLITLGSLALGGCASKNATDVMRDNAYVLQQGGTNQVYLKQTTKDNYQVAIDLIQNIGESGAVKGFTFPSVYSLPTATEETKEKIALQVANRYTPAQLTNMTLRYWETLGAAEMSRWAKDATIKDVISGVIWGNALLGRSTGGRGATGDTQPSMTGDTAPIRTITDNTVGQGIPPAP